jgi:hypothetical protein
MCSAGTRALGLAFNESRKHYGYINEWLSFAELPRWALNLLQFNDFSHLRQIVRGRILGLRVPAKGRMPTIRIDFRQQLVTIWRSLFRDIYLYCNRTVTML